MSRTFAALGSGSYRWYLSGQVVTSTGTWMQRIAQDWLVLELTHGNAAALGMVTALQFLPFVMLTPLAGVLADRFRRTRILLVTSAMGMISAALLGAVVLSGAVTVTWVFALAALLGVAAAVDHPARQAVLGQLVSREHLANAVALNSAGFNLSRVIGPALAGVVIAAAGVGPVFLVNAVTFAWALVAVTKLRPTPIVAESSSAVTFRDGLRYLRSRPDLALVLGSMAIAATFAFNFAIFTVLMAREEFGVDAAAFGLASSVLALGSITGSLLAARRVGRGLAFLFVAGIGFGAATAVSGLMPTYWAFLLFLPICGFLALTYSVSVQSYLQLRSAPEQRGRVMGIYALVFFGGNPIGAPLLGLVAETFGPRWAVIGGGLLAAIGLSVLAWSWRRYRRRHPDMPVPVEQVSRVPVAG